jgi:hypothetical protein
VIIGCEFPYIPIVSQSKNGQHDIGDKQTGNNFVKPIIIPLSFPRKWGHKNALTIEITDSAELAFCFLCCA